MTNAGLEKDTVKGLCSYLLSTPEHQQLVPILSKLLFKGYFFLLQLQIVSVLFPQ